MARLIVGRMIVALCAILAAGLPGWAMGSAEGDVGEGGWHVRTWQTDDGLPDNRVYAVAQAPDGFLWVATRGGLVVFDGSRFRELKSRLKAEVPLREVTAVHFDRRGGAWLGYKHGEVVCAKSETICYFGAEQHLPNAEINQFAGDSDATIVAAYAASAELLQIVQDKPGVLAASAGINTRGEWRVAEGRDGRIWVAKGGIVGLLRDDHVEQMARVTETVSKIATARAGGLWIATARRLLKFEEGRPPEEKGQFPRMGVGGGVSCLLEDRGGAVWIGTPGSGLLRFSDGNFEAVETVDRSIRSLAEDTEGSIWVGTSGGLNQIRPKSIGLLTSSSGVSFESARSVAEQVRSGPDAKSHLWVVTDDGRLVRQDVTNWVVVSAQADWTGGTPTCVAGDANGGMWIGTSGPMLHHFAEGKYQTWGGADGLKGNSVRTLFVGTSNDLWIAVAAPEGLYCLRAGQLQNFPLPEATSAQRVRSIVQDKSGVVWVGTSGGQLLRVEGERLVNWTGDADHRFDSIRCMTVTEDGSLWIGFAGSGLGRLKDGRFARITTKDGLGEDYISQMAADAGGRFWCAGARGLYQTQLEELLAVAEGRAQRLRSVVYGRAEGVKSLQAGERVVTGALRRRNGELCFPARSGLVTVDPKAIRDDAPAPSVCLESVLLDGQLVAHYDGRSPSHGTPLTNLVDLRSTNAFLGLRPNYRKLEITYCAPYFTSPQNVQFRYQLEGFDEGWVEAGAQRSASYPSLPAGEYQFRVTACNELGKWNEAGAAMRMKVTPFFWQTAWFRGGLLGLFTLAMVGVVRYVSHRRLRERLREVERQSALDKERERIARDMHDTLGASLTQINFLGAAASGDAMPAEQIREQVAKITRSSQGLVQQLDEIVWAVDPENDTLDGLATYISQFATEFFMDGSVICRVKVPALLPDLRLTTEVRHNLFLAVKEALNNVARHAGASEVTVNLTVGGRAVVITIEDNGCGFDVAADTRRHGQANLRQRLADIGGSCQVESRPGSGTKVTLCWLHRRL
jgi:signal transduction histidine kinase/ligand-binding sensor domain-containing protein